MKKLVLATSNPGKIKELQEMLDGHYSVISQIDMAIEEVPENGLSFVENALIKARNASRRSGLAALADDSGIVVNALNGEPGIYSARYAGEGATDMENVTKLLSEMDNLSGEDRRASFWCAIVLVRYPDDPTPLIIQRSWDGVITHKARGINGFGYDPIFYLPESRCTSAELSSKQKNLISHRGQALRELLKKLSFED
jgi:XTP/dITP diphosphohydrolase|tara:strand:+ start:90 stop:683 length:594 start_codon:yes stop_codon:yes gene_type:complete